MDRIETNQLLSEIELGRWDHFQESVLVHLEHQQENPTHHFGLNKVIQLAHLQLFKICLVAIVQRIITWTVQVEMDKMELE